MEPTLTPGRAWQPLGERVISALAFGGLAIFVFLLYGHQLVQGTPETLRWIWQPLGLLYLIIDFMNPVFGSLYAFVQGYLLCAGLVIAAVVAGRPRMGGSPRALDWPGGGIGLSILPAVALPALHTLCAAGDRL